MSKGLALVVSHPPPPARLPRASASPPGPPAPGLQPHDSQTRGARVLLGWDVCGRTEVRTGRVRCPETVTSAKGQSMNEDKSRSWSLSRWFFFLSCQYCVGRWQEGQCRHCGKKSDIYAQKAGEHICRCPGPAQRAVGESSHSRGKKNASAQL